MRGGATVVARGTQEGDDAAAATATRATMSMDDQAAVHEAIDNHRYNPGAKDHQAFATRGRLPRKSSAVSAIRV